MKMEENQPQSESPIDSQALRGTLADLQAFIELMESECARLEFEWIGKVFDYLEHQFLAHGDRPCVQKKPRGLKIEPGLQIALQHLNVQDFSDRVARMKVPLDAWQAESRKPRGHRQVLVDEVARKAYFDRTDERAKVNAALRHNVETAAVEVIELFRRLQQQILKRLNPSAVVSKQPIAVPEAELLRLRNIKRKIDPENTYLGESVAILRVFDRIDLLNLQPHESVLIRGESGSGKTRVASLIHSSSDRVKDRFVEVQASDFFGHDERFARYELEGYGPTTGIEGWKKATKLGLLEEYMGGTIFIDEIADVPDWFQTSILRVLDKKEIRREGNGKSFVPDVRLVFATNKPLETMVSEHKFRGDFLRRIGQRTIEIPPLGERREDVLNFVEKHCGDSRRDPAFIAALLEHDWPGNVGELIDVLNLAARLAAKQHGEGGKVCLLADHLEAVAPAMSKVVKRWTAMERVERESKSNSVIDTALMKQGYQKNSRIRPLNARKAKILDVKAYELSRRKGDTGKATSPGRSSETARAD